MLIGRRRRRRAPAVASEPVPTDALCLLPWVNLSIDVDGSTRPCCKFAHDHDVDGAPLHNVAEHSLQEAWASPGLAELRRQFLAGGRPSGCASCWSEEAAGIASFRQTYLHDRGIDQEVDVTSTELAPPRGMDLKLSNTCNLACRICGPVASSRWLAEELREVGGVPRPGGFHAYLAEHRRFFADTKLLHRPDDVEALRRWAPGVQHLELTGGEPMLSAESAELLLLLVEHGSPSSTSLQITTNATTMDPRIIDHLERFRKVTVSLSVDDIGERFEYQRANGSWPEVEENIARYAELADALPGVGVYLNVTVSAFNAWTLPTYLWWWRDRYGPGSPIGLSLNLLHHPQEQCVQHLPDALAAAMLASWATQPAWSDPATRPHLDEVIAFAGSAPADPAIWARFAAEARRIDERRGESLERSHPELVAAARAAGCWPEDGTPVQLRAP